MPATIMLNSCKRDYAKDAYWLGACNVVVTTALYVIANMDFDQLRDIKNYFCRGEYPNGIKKKDKAKKVQKHL